MENDEARQILISMLQLRNSDRVNAAILKAIEALDIVDALDKVIAHWRGNDDR